MFDVRRREFITLLGGAAASCACWPLAARAQQQRMPTIGILVPANPEPFASEFETGLRERGYSKGQSIAFEFRSAEGKPDRLRTLADELVQRKVDVIVAQFTPAIVAARHATTEIPIVMAWGGNPVGTGLISSLARPGGNITGLASPAGLNAKVLEHVRDVLPSARRVAVLTNPNDPFSQILIAQNQEAGRSLGIAIQVIGVQNATEFDAAFAAMVKERADAVVMQLSLPRQPAIELALKHRLPLVATSRLLPREGGLMSYSINQNEMYRRAAFYADRLLKGAKAADLPVEQPSRFELVVNLKTAKALGLEIPPTVLARADEVIE
jgi:putative ABC transport system substrate-binding protein